MQIGNKNVFINGDSFEADVVPSIVVDRTLVSTLVLEKTLGATVEYNSEAQTVSITK